MCIIVGLFWDQVDCISSSETCEKFGVNGYPTLKIFRGGEEASSYEGPHTAGLLLITTFNSTQNQSKV